MKAIQNIKIKLLPIQISFKDQPILMTDIQLSHLKKKKKYINPMTILISPINKIIKLLVK